MRRIIERVVTVVTTTTWSITWQEDPPPPNSPSGPVDENLSQPQLPQNTQQSGQSAKEDSHSEANQ